MFPNCACGTNAFDRNHTIYGIGGKSLLVRCSSCGLYRWNASLDFTYGNIAKEYRSGGRNYFSTTPEQEINWHRDIFSPRYFEIARRISRLNKGAIKLLDGGCALGHLLGSLKTLKPDWDLRGIEINPAYVSFARRRGLEVYEGELSEALAQYHSDFDIIVLTELLEHLDSPSNVLTRVRESLKVGGYVVLSVPNLQSLIDLYILRGRSSLSIPYQHLWFFTMRTLTNLLRANGFITVNCKTVSFFAAEAVGIRRYIGKLANIALDLTTFGGTIFFVGRRL